MYCNVLLEMKSCGKNSVCYHKTDNSRLELDFVIQYEGELLPIEVKAEDAVRANSLTALLRSTPGQQAVRLSKLPYKKRDQFHSVILFL